MVDFETPNCPHLIAILLPTPPPPYTYMLICGKSEQLLTWKSPPEYHSGTLVQCSGTVMCCVMVKSRQRSSERMLNCSHTPVVDNKVGIVFGIDKVVSFVVGKKESPLDSPPLPYIEQVVILRTSTPNLFPVPTLEVMHLRGVDWQWCVCVFVCVCVRVSHTYAHVTSPQGEKQSWQRSITFHPNFKMESKKKTKSQFSC